MLSCLAYSPTRRWRRYVPLKCRLTFNELHGIITQIELFITTVVRTSNTALKEMFARSPCCYYAFYKKKVSCNKSYIYFQDYSHTLNQYAILSVASFAVTPHVPPAMMLLPLAGNKTVRRSDGIQWHTVGINFRENRTLSRWFHTPKNRFS
jgi:hypothetical protein